jgi:uncharacterized FlaG/YvyC family protein
LWGISEAGTFLLKLSAALPISRNKGVCAFSERFEMEISSVQPNVGPSPQAPPVAAEEAAQRRELIQATKSVNESRLLGRNQLVFLVDRATHKPIIRVEDPDTHEVVMQLPPDYVLRLAQDLQNG